MEYATKTQPPSPIKHQAAAKTPNRFESFREQDNTELSIRYSTSTGISSKLSVGATDSPHEHEADQIASAVMRMPKPLDQRGDTSNEFQSRSGATGKTISLSKPVESGIHQVIRSGGQSLSEQDRSFFEPRFQQDFSQVRIHTTKQAAAIANTINSRALTVGNHIVFGSGHCTQPTLAHELGHIRQNNGASVPCSNIVRRAPDNDQSNLSPLRNINALEEAAKNATTKNDEFHIIGYLGTVTDNEAPPRPIIAVATPTGLQFVYLRSGEADLIESATDLLAPKQSIKASEWKRVVNIREDGSFDKGPNDRKQDQEAEKLSKWLNTNAPIWLNQQRIDPTKNIIPPENPKGREVNDREIQNAMARMTNTSRGISSSSNDALKELQPNVLGYEATRSAYEKARMTWEKYVSSNPKENPTTIGMKMAAELSSDEVKKIPKEYQEKREYYVRLAKTWSIEKAWMEQGMKESPSEIELKEIGRQVSISDIEEIRRTISLLSRNREPTFKKLFGVDSVETVEKRELQENQENLAKLNLLMRLLRALANRNNPPPSSPPSTSGEEAKKFRTDENILKDKENTTKGKADGKDETDEEAEKEAKAEEEAKGEKVKKLLRELLRKLEEQKIADLIKRLTVGGDSSGMQGAHEARLQLMALEGTAMTEAATALAAIITIVGGEVLAGAVPELIAFISEALEGALAASATIAPAVRALILRLVQQLTQLTPQLAPALTAGAVAAPILATSPAQAAPKPVQEKPKPRRQPTPSKELSEPILKNGVRFEGQVVYPNDKGEYPRWTGLPDTPSPKSFIPQSKGQDTLTQQEADKRAEEFHKAVRHLPAFLKLSQNPAFLKKYHKWVTRLIREKNYAAYIPIMKDFVERQSL